MLRSSDVRAFSHIVLMSSKCPCMFCYFSELSCVPPFRSHFASRFCFVFAYVCSVVAKTSHGRGTVHRRYRRDRAAFAPRSARRWFSGRALATPRVKSQRASPPPCSAGLVPQPRRATRALCRSVFRGTARFRRKPLQGLPGVAREKRRFQVQGALPQVLGVAELAKVGGCRRFRPWADHVHVVETHGAWGARPFSGAVLRVRMGWREERVGFGRHSCTNRADHCGTREF